MAGRLRSTRRSAQAQRLIRAIIRPAFREARSHLAVILGSGFAVGVCLGLSTVVIIRWGQ